MLWFVAVSSKPPNVMIGVRHAKYMKKNEARHCTCKASLKSLKYHGTLRITSLRNPPNNLHTKQSTTEHHRTGVIMTSRLAMWWSSNSNSTMFELQTFPADSKCDKFSKRFVAECEFVGKSLFYDHFICRESQRVHTNLFFLKFNLSHKLQLLNVKHNFCSEMCYTVLIWT